ncbi:hypothetical protein K438DRAFT_1997665 [Mycena galopus ATCC 62051]|nr:hypothetical protein K438DRAFT_1997665 [Mycena galopus ATCC 62051]
MNITTLTYSEECVARFIEKYPPRSLKTLAFDSPRGWYDTSIQLTSLLLIEKLLRLGTHSLVNLTLESTFLDEEGELDSAANNKFIEMLHMLPAFPALAALTIWLGPNHQAKHMLNALAATALATLIFRIGLYGQDSHLGHNNIGRGLPMERLPH